MVIRIEMLNGEEDGEEKREEKGKFWWGSFGSPCPFFFTRVPLLADFVFPSMYRSTLCEVRSLSNVASPVAGIY